MGQGSRGGNGGLSSSGARQRTDKDLQRQKNNPRTVGKGGTGGAGGEGGKGGKGGRRGLGGHNFPNLGVPHFGGPNTSGSSSAKKGTAAKSKKGKTTKPPAASKTAKIPSIKRVRGPKVKLTKQRVNKTPN